MRIPLTLLAILIPTAAMAHGAHDWIRKGGYKSANQTSCCDERDCFRGGVSNLKRIEGGYEFDAAVNGKVYRLTIRDAAVHASVNADYWFCALPADLAGKVARCLFVPGTS